MEKTIFEILRVLDGEAGALGSAELARRLRSRGIDLSERTIRYYLLQLEAKGYVVGEKKKGRMLTVKGRRELHEGFVAERIGSVTTRIDNLSVLCDLDIDTFRGRVILNVAYVSEDNAGPPSRSSAACSIRRMG
jgi:repressor of nif and glnA expression